MKNLETMTKFEFVCWIVALVFCEVDAIMVSIRGFVSGWNGMTIVWAIVWWAITITGAILYCVRVRGLILKNIDKTIEELEESVNN